MSVLRRNAWALCAAIAVTAAACGATDPGITTAVKTKLAADDIVKAHEINVDTSEGVVTLTGTVPSAAAKDRAMAIARETDGVRSVVDRLAVVAPPEPSAIDSAAGALTDAAVTSAVKTRLLADPTVAGLKIDVDTADGVVTLIGVVKTIAEKEKAVSLARDTTGVRSVTDQLKVGR